MPSPPFVTLPEGVRPVHVETLRGTFAALAASAAGDLRGTVVLVPGYTGSKENLIAVLRPLADAGHRVLAIDLRGQFETPGVQDASAYTMDALGADVTAVLDILEAGPVHIVGHSVGGLVSRAAALDRPDLLASLTLLDSGPAALGGHQGVRIGQLIAALRTTPQEQVWEAMEALNSEDPAMADRTAEIVEFQHRRFIGSSPEALIETGENVLNEVDRVDELAAAASFPILVAYGSTDAHWSTEEQAAMAKRLGARCEAIAATGHNPAADAPAETARVLIDFFASAEAAVTADQTRTR